MSKVKFTYSKLPTSDYSSDDDCRVDIDLQPPMIKSSAFTYETSAEKGARYRSVFTYARPNSRPTTINEIYDIETEYNPTLLSKVIVNVIVGLSSLLFIITFPISLLCYIKEIKQDERGVVFRLGRLQRVREPGYRFFLPFIDKLNKVPVETRAFNVPPVQILMSDHGMVELGASVYYRITDVVSAVTLVQDINHALRRLAQTLVNSTIKAYNTDDTSSKISDMQIKLKDSANETCKVWGVNIEKFELSHVKVIKEPPAVPNALQTLFSGLKSSGSSFPPGLSQVLQQIATIPAARDRRQHAGNKAEQAEQGLTPLVEVPLEQEQQGAAGGGLGGAGVAAGGAGVGVGVEAAGVGAGAAGVGAGAAGVGVGGAGAAGSAQWVTPYNVSKLLVSVLESEGVSDDVRREVNSRYNVTVSDDSGRGLETCHIHLDLSSTATDTCSTSTQPVVLTTASSLETPPPRADVTLSMSATTLYQLLARRTHISDAYLSGSVTVQDGELARAARLAPLITHVDAAICAAISNAAASFSS